MGTDGRLEPFRCHLKLTRLRVGMRFVWRSTRLVYRLNKVLNREKPKRQIFKCKKMEETDAVFNKIKRTYIFIGKRAHRKQNFNPSLTITYKDLSQISQA